MLELLETKTTDLNLLPCEHCQEFIEPGDKLIVADYKDKTHYFCCEGCKTLYLNLHLAGLEKFYSYRKSSTQIISKNKSTEEASKLNLNLNLEIAPYTTHIKLKLDGIQCLGCLWIFDQGKIQYLFPEITYSHYSADRGTLELYFKQGESSPTTERIQEIIFLLNQLGPRLSLVPIPPTQLNIEEQEENKFNHTQKKLINYLGISGFCTGNIMLISIAEYAGAASSPTILKFLHFFQMFLAVPVMTYCVWPVYAEVIKGLKNKYAKLTDDWPTDLPLAIAFFLGTILGIYGYFANTDQYWDSLTGFVLLLWLSRYFLTIGQKHSTASNSFIHTLRHDVFTSTHKVGDIITAKPKSLVVVDGIISEGKSLVDTQLINGESEAKAIELGNSILAGSINIENEIKIKVTKVAQETSLSTLLETLSKQKKSMAKTSEQIWSQYFLLGQISLFLICIAYHLAFSELTLFQIIYRAITMLVVSCPCALTLCAPLLMQKTLKRFESLGLITKSEGHHFDLEKNLINLSLVQEIFWDKTGTLTLGKYKIDGFKFILNSLSQSDEADYLLKMLAMQRAAQTQSCHPISVALEKSVLHELRLRGINPLESERKFIPQNFKIQFTQGISAEFFGVTYRFLQGEFYSEEELIATWHVSDMVRPGIDSEINSLRQKGLIQNIISGDKQSNVDEFIKDFQDGTFKRASGGLTPDAKSQIISSNKHKTLMIGDGLNDTLAFKGAGCSIAVKSALPLGLATSDFYYSPSLNQSAQPQALPVNKWIETARVALKTLKRNRILSLSYNLVSLTLAFNGLIHPLIAAIIMPLSSLTVFLSTQLTFKEDL